MKEETLKEDILKMIEDKIERAKEILKLVRVNPNFTFLKFCDDYVFPTGYTK